VILNPLFSFFVNYSFEITAAILLILMFMILIRSMIIVSFVQNYSY